MDALTNYHTLGGLNSKLIFSQFWRFEIPRSGCGKVWFLLRPFLLACRWPHSSLSPCGLCVCAPGVAVSTFPLLGHQLDWTSAPPVVRSGGGRSKGATGNFWGVMPLFTVLNMVMVSWAYSHVVFEYIKFTILYTVIKATYACCTHLKYIYLFVILLSSHKEFEVDSPLYPTIPCSLAAFPPLF